MRTCQSIEERQANLSRKLARATSLIRSWIDVELERQNSDLLNTMNRRAEMQLRLQQTVEGLSVAAISYYVVGLFGYFIKAIPHEDLPLDPVIATGLFVPIALRASGGRSGGSGCGMGSIESSAALSRCHALGYTVIQE